MREVSVNHVTYFLKIIINNDNDRELKGFKINTIKAKRT